MPSKFPLRYLGLANDRGHQVTGVIIDRVHKGLDNALREAVDEAEQEEAERKLVNRDPLVLGLQVSSAVHKIE